MYNYYIVTIKVFNYFIVSVINVTVIMTIAFFMAKSGMSCILTFKACFVVLGGWPESCLAPSDLLS